MIIDILSEDPLVDGISVPVTIDRPQVNSQFDYDRCTYFMVESEPERLLDIGVFYDPFFLLTPLGSVVILAIPSGARPFTNAREIEDVFVRLDNRAHLSLSVGDIWLPSTAVSQLFRETPTLRQRGTTIRVALRLFVAAFQLRRELIDRSVVESVAGSLQDPAFFDPTENDAFKQWRRQKIETAQTEYHADRQRHLNRKTGSGPAGGARP